MEIKFFDGSLEEFIKSLEKQTIAKVLRTIDLLEEFGHKLGLPHSRKVSNCLLELRVRGKQEVRIFYTFHKNQIILLHGFMKKSQKIPAQEIKIAVKRQRGLTNYNI